MTLWRGVTSRATGTGMERKFMPFCIYLAVKVMLGFRVVSSGEPAPIPARSYAGIR